MNKQLIVVKVGTSSLTGADGSMSPEKVGNIVRQIADVEIDDKISFVIKKTEEIMEDSEYQGVRLSLDAYLDKTRIPLKIDISTGDVTPLVKYRFCTS